MEEEEEINLLTGKIFTCLQGHKKGICVQSLMLLCSYLVMDGNKQDLQKRIDEFCEFFNTMTHICCQAQEDDE